MTDPATPKRPSDSVASGWRAADVDDDTPTRVGSSTPVIVPPTAEPDADATHTLPGGSGEQPAGLRQVGRYLIRERLGHGGMATVFKAHDPGIGRDVAIKFLHPSLCEEPEYRARFLSEPELMCRSGALAQSMRVTRPAYKPGLLPSIASAPATVRKKASAPTSPATA